MPVSGLRGFLSLLFLARFPHMKCHIQGQGFGNKIYISELFTVVGYLHTTGFKNRPGINCAKSSAFAFLEAVNQKQGAQSEPLLFKPCYPAV